MKQNRKDIETRRLSRFIKHEIMIMLMSKRSLTCSKQYTTQIQFINIFKSWNRVISILITLPLLLKEQYLIGFRKYFLQTAQALWTNGIHIARLNHWYDFTVAAFELFQEDIYIHTPFRIK